MGKQNEPTLHQRIMRAAKHGKGLHLDANDVLILSLDHSIAQCAMADDVRDVEEGIYRAPSN